MNAKAHMIELRQESERLLAMNAAWDRMFAAAKNRNNKGFELAREEFWSCQKAGKVEAQAAQ